MIAIDDWTVGLGIGLTALPLGMMALVFAHTHPKFPRVDSVWSLVIPWLMAGVGVGGVTQSWLAWGVAALGILISLWLGTSLKDYYRVAPSLLTAIAFTILAGIGWNGQFLASLSLSRPTGALVILNYGLGWLTLIAGFVIILPTQAFLLRKFCRRPCTALPLQSRKVYPKVSVHVPCCAEPPDVVCATLAAIAAIDYPNFEVLLVDNNTPDPALWQPVQLYCDELNRLAKQTRFRFFHVEKLAGAKAGALNFALCHTDPAAELIAVVDADYQPNADFLGRLVGFFDDPNIGFVQTPHDYRDWPTNRYLRGCYWEYMSFFRLQLAGLNEWSASYIIGTMCLLRKAALAKAGGWSQWCLTEDSEVAVRIHALGYRSLFLTESFGRGLIPKTFHDYKKQRLRWTIGPIQQLQHHWRLYLPKPWAKPSQLTPWQKYVELSHSLGGLLPLLMIALIPLNLMAIASLQIHQENVPLPSIVWFGGAMTILTGLLGAWLTYWLLGCRRWQDMGLAMLAALSLQHTRLLGAFIALFARSPQWKRTNKFQLFPNHWRAWQSCQTELMLGVCCGLLALSLFSLASAESDWIWGISLGLALTAIPYFAAGVMAWLGEAELQRTLGLSAAQTRLDPLHRPSPSSVIVNSGKMS